MFWKYLLYCTLAVVGILVILLIIAIIRAATKGKKLPAQDNYTLPRQRQDEYADKLGQMIMQPTVAVERGGKEEVFALYYATLEQLFPLFFKTAQLIPIQNAYLWLLKGKEQGDANVVMAHSDVVSADGVWSYPPYSATIAEGKLYGRGTQDIKGMLFTELQGAENLLAQGWQPKHDLYFISGKDEEGSGSGAKHCVKWFEQNNITIDTVFDEGGAITNDVFPSVTNELALMGLAEKGYIDLRFVATRKGGHASAPKKDNAVAALAAFIHYCESRQLFKRRYLPLIKDMFSTIAPYCSFALRIPLCNMWLFGGLLKKVLPLVSAQVGALLGTTITFTVLNGSTTTNVMPTSASAVANIRNLNGESTEEVIEKMSKLAKKFNLTMEVLNCKPTSSITNKNCEMYQQLSALVTKHMPSTIPTPFLMIGATDSCALDKLMKQTVRLCPIRVTNKQMNTVHAEDENIGVTELAVGVEFMQDYLALK